ncbi:unnamed protein product [Lactuca saligna]|uniref:Uncharacterized protein n=1 Tax=Lactuca saligna TaxID=75948 RepID=A0AA35V3U2_LACSI|nr:unnamed protein product [Lactuca saligna]
MTGEQISVPSSPKNGEDHSAAEPIPKTQIRNNDRSLYSMLAKHSGNHLLHPISLDCWHRWHKKKSKELSSLYATQEFSAHNGYISIINFSHDGRYLASAGMCTSGIHDMYRSVFCLYNWNCANMEDLGIDRINPL